MAEDPQPQSITQRIAALNQAHIGRVPGDPPLPRPKPPLPTTRPKSFNNPPAKVVGSVTSNSGIGNEPNGVREKEILSPPQVTRTTSNTLNKQKAVPPPLPTRKSSTQPSPALPPRRPTERNERRDSSESTISTISTISGVSINTTLANGARRKSTDAARAVKAPAWGDTDLPPLPVRPAEKSTTEARSSQDRPKYAVRAPSSTQKITPTISSENLRPSQSNPSLPPRLPSRTKSIPRFDDGPSQKIENKEPTRKLPPPVPSAAALEKVRRSALSFGLNKPKDDQTVEISDQPTSNGVDTHNQTGAIPSEPPPVPLASRPDLSKIQATKPNPSQSATSCMTCRDFSAPDHHATLFPRQTVRSLPELAQSLTAPFPSHTDKARALFTWLHHNIRYDVDAFFNNALQPSTPSSTLNTGLAVCEGYAALFHNLATHAGLESVSISGHGKGFGYAPFTSPPPFDSNHAWNAVKIDHGEWKLIDCCWGAGHVQGKGQPYQQTFHPECFTMSNEEFSLKHFATNKDQLFGATPHSWPEYIMINPDTYYTGGVEPPTLFSNAKADYGIGARTLRPSGKKIGIREQGPLRFGFALLCPHWSLDRHVRKGPPPLFILAVHGLDGRKDDFVPFQYLPGPGGAGDRWVADVRDRRELGAPGQGLTVFAVTSFNERKDERQTRGLGIREWEEGRKRRGGVAMGFVGVAAWEIV
ncbi:MAG: hypothetical protein Q9227_005511 [Pyrenula ochraceoflavens]